MTLDEAAKILEQQHNFRDTPYAVKVDDALTLGIEALRGIEAVRYFPLPNSLKQLPSETEEAERLNLPDSKRYGIHFKD